MGFLDWVNVRRADGAAWRHPRLVPDELAVGFWGGLEGPDPLAKQRGCNDPAFDCRRRLRLVFGGLCHRCRGLARLLLAVWPKLVEPLSNCQNRSPAALTESSMSRISS